MTGSADLQSRFRAPFSGAHGLLQAFQLPSETCAALASPAGSTRKVMRDTGFARGRNSYQWYNWRVIAVILVVVAQCLYSLVFRPSFRSYPHRFEEAGVSLNLGVPSSAELGPSGLRVYRPDRGEFLSPGEHFAVHSHVCLSESGPYYVLGQDGVPPFRRCSAWNGRDIEWTECERVTKYAFELGDSVGKDWMSVYNPESVLRTPSPDALWYDRTGLLVILNPRDVNVCHITMRLLQAFAYTLRVKMGLMDSQAQVPSAIVLMTPSELGSYVNPAVSGSDEQDVLPYHAGLIRALFTKSNMAVILAGSLHSLIEKNSPRDGFFSGLQNGMKPSPDVCFRSIVHTGSFADRFALPDKDFQAESKFRRAEADSLTSSLLPGNMSTEAVALLDAVVPNSQRPESRKIVYFARDADRDRAFVEKSEKDLRSLLRTIALELGGELLIAETGTDASNVRKAMSFGSQIARVADAKVVLGLHGAGLALCNFMPLDGTSIVELVPPRPLPGMFHAISKYSERSYDKLTISRSNLERFDMKHIVLEAEDLLAIDVVVRQRLLEV